MGETPNSAWQCTIHLTSQDDASADEAWQDTCRQLYQRLTTIIRDEQGEIHPLQQPAPAGAKADMLELFHHIVAYGLSIGAFTGIYNLAKLWLEQRHAVRSSWHFLMGVNSKCAGCPGPKQSESSRNIRPGGQKKPQRSCIHKSLADATHVMCHGEGNAGMGDPMRWTYPYLRNMCYNAATDIENYLPPEGTKQGSIGELWLMSSTLNTHL